MEEDKEYLNQDISRAATKTMERDPKTASINAIKKSLGEFTDHSLKTEDEANSASLLPGFIHLNPDLLASAIIFRYKTRSKPLNKIPKKELNRRFREILTFRFPVVKNDKTKYTMLKGDLIRYIRIIEIEQAKE